MGLLWNTDRILYDSPHFKESLQVVNLSKGHGHQHQSLKERPQHHPAVRVVIDWRTETKIHSKINIHKLK